MCEGKIKVRQAGRTDGACMVIPVAPVRSVVAFFQHAMRDDAIVLKALQAGFGRKNGGLKRPDRVPMGLASSLHPSRFHPCKLKT